MFISPEITRQKYTRNAISSIVSPIRHFLFYKKSYNFGSRQDNVQLFNCTVCIQDVQKLLLILIFDGLISGHPVFILLTIFLCFELIFPWTINEEDIFHRYVRILLQDRRRTDSFKTSFFIRRPKKVNFSIYFFLVLPRQKKTQL